MNEPWLKKAWSVVLLVIVAVIAVDLLKIAVQPYLPILGLLVVAAFIVGLIYVIVRIVKSRNDHW